MSDQRIEIQEAIDAGNRALAALNRVDGSISTARGLGVWDILGGGFISGMMKHAKLDDAQRDMELAQRELERFNRELQDVNTYYNVSIRFDGFSRFADYFLDGLLVDFIVQDKIAKTQTEVRNIINQVQDTLDNLYRCQR